MSILVLRNYILTQTSPSLNCQKTLPSSENVIPLIILMSLLIRINGLDQLLISMLITTQKAIASTSQLAFCKHRFMTKTKVLKRTMVVSVLWLDMKLPMPLTPMVPTMMRTATCITGGQKRILKLSTRGSKPLKTSGMVWKFTGLR